MLEVTVRHGSKAESWKAIPSSRRFAELGGRLSVDQRRSRGRSVESGEDAQHRGLTAAGRPEQRQKDTLAGLEVTRRSSAVTDRRPIVKVLPRPEMSRPVPAGRGVVTGLVIPAQYERPIAVMLPARHRCVRAGSASPVTAPW